MANTAMAKRIIIPNTFGLKRIAVIFDSKLVVVTLPPEVVFIIVPCCDADVNLGPKTLPKAATAMTIAIPIIVHWILVSFKLTLGVSRC
mgnify:CR=1 FL=1